MSTIVGVILTLFFFWKRLKEDYSSKEIFTCGFYIIIGVLLGSLGINYLFAGFWFWGGVLGFLTGLFLSIYRFKMKIFETLEAAGIGIVYWLGVIFLEDFIKFTSSSSFAALVFIISILGLFYFLDIRYKNFTWYKSGRVGFSGLATLGILFLVRGVVASLFPFMISFSSNFKVIDTVFSGVISFSLFLAIFNLSQK